MDSISPDERVFRDHVDSSRFVDGINRGRWRIVGDIVWPHVLVAVSAAPRNNAPKEYFLLFDLSGYPESAPTATPWNPETGDALGAEMRPKGERAGHVFRSDWEGGKALYAPFDRVALERYHPDWRERYPRQAWNATRDIVWILQFLHELLNDADYIGI